MIRALLTRRLLGLAIVASLFCLPASVADAAGSTKVVTYRGHSVTVPSRWRVYRISTHSNVCVRFNRNAVYLGRPGSTQLCPPHAIGRRDAILIEPLAGSTAPRLLDSARIVDRRHGVVVTATWGRGRRAIRRALGVRSLARLAAVSYARPRPAAAAAQPAAASVARSRSPRLVGPGPSLPGANFNGEGFDACSAPSTTAMAAWASSTAPYAAIGVYLGGENAACSNLTADWVTTESQAGWHLIPIYVGLQAPKNSCGCAPINPNQAVAEGEADAASAAAYAQALGIGVGNPIYFDMEAYTHDQADTTAVLAFLQAWTGALRAHGYLSGIYSSTGSGISDLVAQYGTSYLEPDDIWFADWNNQKIITDPALPASDWVLGHRLHQYSGAHNETHNGVKLNIDGDYLDADTAAAGSGHLPATTVPAASVSPTITGHPLIGQVLTAQPATWTGYPYLFSYQWERCDNSGANCQAIPKATGTRYRLRASDAHHTFRIVETAGNILGNGPPSTSGATPSIHKHPSGFWTFSATGKVWTSTYEAFYGSPVSHHLTVSNIVGMAATTDGAGYWLAASDGTTYAYGDAAAVSGSHHRNPIVGIVASPTGGYWLYTAQGNIYAAGGAGFHGSLHSKHVNVNSVVGLAPTPDGGGYWVVTRWGAVYAFGDAPHYPRMKHSYPIIGILSSPQDGYWLYTGHGNIYRTKGTPFYGSMNSKHIAIDTITSMTASPHGTGYWFASSTGSVYHFGKAKPFRHPIPTTPVLGIVGQ